MVCMWNRWDRQQPEDGDGMENNYDQRSLDRTSEEITVVLYIRDKWWFTNRDIHSAFIYL